MQSKINLLFPYILKFNFNQLLNMVRKKFLENIKWYYETEINEILIIFIIYCNTNNIILVKFSIWFPSVWITLSIHPLKFPTVACCFFCDIFAHAFTRDLKASTLSWDKEQTSVYNMDHTLNPLLQNLGKLSWHIFESFWMCMRDGYPVGRKNSQFLKWFFISWRAGVKILFIYTFLFTFTPSFPNIRSDFHVLDITAHTTTDTGLWQWLTPELYLVALCHLDGLIASLQ